MRVLLIEPNEAERRHYTTLLAKCLPLGTTVDAVRTAEDALVLVKSDEFHLVVAEHRLPRLSGVDLLRFLRRYAPDAVRVLTTTLAQPSHLRQVQVAAEPHLVIVKNGDTERWCEELRRLLASRGLGEANDVVPGPAASPPAPRSRR